MTIPAIVGGALSTHTWDSSAGTAPSLTISVPAGSIIVIASTALSDDPYATHMEIAGVDGAGLTWQQKDAYGWYRGTGAWTTLELWWAYTPIALSDETITITMPQTVIRQVAMVMAFSGCNIEEPWGPFGWGPSGQSGNPGPMTVSPEFAPNSLALVIENAVDVTDPGPGWPIIDEVRSSGGAIPPVHVGVWSQPFESGGIMSITLGGADTSDVFLTAALQGLPTVVASPDNGGGSPANRQGVFGMVAGLAVDDVVSVQVVLTPTPVQFRNFGTLLIAGSSDVIDTGERIRIYAGVDDIASDFGTTAPEYKAALAYFGQAQKPNQVMIGRWAKTATHGALHGGIFSNAEQASLLTTLQGISNGSFAITINGVAHDITACDFHLITNLNGAASVIAAKLAALVGSSTCTWMPDSLARFNLVSGTTGVASSMSFGQPVSPTSGTDISATLRLTAATFAATPVSGVAAETPLVAAQLLVSTTQLFGCYAFGFALAAFSDMSDADHEAVAAHIEAMKPSHTYWMTSNESSMLDSTITTDVASVLNDLGYNRTYVQYSSSSLYAAFAAFAKFAVVDPNANNSMITLKFKQETGVVAETLTESQAATLKTKCANVFVNYNNGVAILQEGMMSSGQFADTIWGADWLQNRVQTDVFNLLYTTPTKIPQTEAGIHRIQTTVEAGLSAAVFNGWIAPGQWNADGFGQLQPGMNLPKGFYVYTPPLSQQAESDRASRHAPVMQCAVKLSGAVHYANVIINVNP